MIAKLSPLLGVFLVLAVPALAQTAPTVERDGSMAACRAEAKSLCGTVEAGGGRRIACLIENKAKLSPECAQAVEARAGAGGKRRGERASGLGGPASEPTAKPQDAEEQARSGAGGPAAEVPGGPAAPGERANVGRGRMAACRTDAATLCGGADKGAARARCMRENQAKLSPDCQAAMKERAERGGQLREACKTDQASLCGSVERGGGRRMQCLRDNREKLSAACSAALASMPERGKRKGKGA